MASGKEKIDNVSGCHYIAKRRAARSITCVDADARPGASLWRGGIRPRCWILGAGGSFLSRVLEQCAQAAWHSPAGQARATHLSFFR
jgi:hypothetical protein